MREFISQWTDSSAVLWALASAIVAAFGALLGAPGVLSKRFPNRPSRFVRIFDGMELWGVVLTVLGAVLAVFATISSGREAIQANADKIALNQQLQMVAAKASSATDTAIKLTGQLNQTDTTLQNTVRELEGTYKDLAEAKLRLRRVESLEKWRSLSKEQKVRLQAILSKYQGSFMAINPIAGDNEAFYFSKDIQAVFVLAGWKTGWVDFMQLSSSSPDNPLGPSRATEGIELQMPEFVRTTEKYKQLNDDLQTAIHIIDAHATVRYTNGKNDGLHVQIGGRRHD